VNNNQDGFTLIEAIMAIGILAVVAVQILNVQSSTILVTASARDNMVSTWVLRSIVSQVEYAVDTVGTKAMPKTADFPWSGNNEFKVSIALEDTPIEASRLMSTAMKLGKGQLAAEEGGEPSSEEVGGDLKEIGALLDSQIPKDLYRTVQVKVTWPVGENRRTAETGMLLIDTSQVNLLKQLGGLPPPGEPGTDPDPTSSPSPTQPPDP
jgi:prepilin-type N-terminal cleavage/methylation domain-containing protein